MFGSLGGEGGLLGLLQRQFNSGAPPSVPADGTMQPMIGPGMTPPAARMPPVKFGLPQGGILGLLQGQSPQGLLGLLQRGMAGPPAAPLAGAMPQAGMIPGLGAAAAPLAPPAAPPQLPMDINPMNQF